MTVRVDSCVPWLIDRARNVHSQFGEDGLIEAVFEEIGTVNRWCFEVGALDGIQFSNTKALWDTGWDAVLIEADSVAYSKLAELASASVRCVNARIDAHQLEDILDFHGAPRNLDFGVIDIDGQDYWVWSGMSRFQPRVMLIEYSPYVADPTFIPEREEEGQGGKRQAGLTAMRRLGESLGYTEVARTFCNLLFVKDTEL